MFHNPWPGTKDLRWHSSPSHSLMAANGVSELTGGCFANAEHAKRTSMTTVASYRIPGFGEVNVVRQNDAGHPLWDLFASGEWLNEGHPFGCQPRRAQVEAFLAEKLKGVLARVSKECRRLKIQQEDLDELVHEAAQADNPRLNEAPGEKRQERLITSVEARACRVNNRGRADQIIYLLEAYGEAGVITVLRGV